VITNLARRSSYRCRDSGERGLQTLRNAVSGVLLRTEAQWINQTYRVVMKIGVEVDISAKPHRVFRNPAASFWIVVTRSEPHQPSVRIIESAGETEGLEGRICVGKYIA
jgi:hypothetical protein